MPHNIVRNAEQHLVRRDVVCANAAIGTDAVKDDRSEYLGWKCLCLVYPEDLPARLCAPTGPPDAFLQSPENETPLCVGKLISVPWMMRLTELAWPGISYPIEG